MRLIITSFILFFSLSIYAQTEENPFSFSLFTAKTASNSDLGNGILNFDQPYYGGAGFSIGTYLSPSFDLEFSGLMSHYGYYSQAQNFLSRRTQLDVVAKYKFDNGYLLREQAIFAPYAFIGIGGASNAPIENRAEETAAFTLPVGLGISYNFTPKLNFFAQAGWQYEFTDKTDQINIDGNDNLVVYRLGAKYNFSIGEKEDPNKDTDGDGVIDIEDQCPETPGEIESNGCPEIEQSTIDVFEEALVGVQFEFEKATILESSYSILDKVVTILEEHPSYKLIIEGHTDAKGSDEYNLNLSKKRAESVKSYLENKGIASSRLEAQGIGEKRPIATNETDEGRARNRRVEFIIMF